MDPVLWIRICKDPNPNNFGRIRILKSWLDPETDPDPGQKLSQSLEQYCRRKNFSIYEEQ
jgi:hypothetical protein